MKPVFAPRIPWCLVLLLGLGSLLGCRAQEQIQVYETPKPETAPKPDRMLAAIVLKNEKAWFFKATTTRPQAEKLEATFRRFVESVAFSPDGVPRWEMPAGWASEPNASSLRFATLKADVDGDAVELSVSELPWSGDNENDYLLRNVNRWRGQMKARPWLLIELIRDRDALKLAGSEPAWFFALDGQAASSGPSMPTGHPSVGGPSPGPSTGPSTGPPRSAATSASAGGLRYQTPAGWVQGQQTGGMRKAAFDVTSQQGSAEITVIDLPGSSGSFVDNVNRWRTQVSLEPSSPTDIEKNAQPIDVGGITGRLVDLQGEKESILGVIVPSGGKTWFIKMRGDSAVAEAEKERFQQFVRSLQLP